MDSSNSNPTLRYWLCPLYSFDCYFESVDLTEGIQIKHAPDELRKYIAERTHHLYGRWADPSKFDWAAFLPYHAKVIEGATIEERFLIGFKEHDRIGDLLFDLITALRLVHKGRIVPGPLMSGSINNSEWSIGGTTIWTLVSKRDFLLEKPEYILHQSDVSQVNELVSNLSNLRELGKLDSLSIALGRFHSAYHGPIEDRIIDQMIAFESLYIGDDKELGYKLRLRTAFLLGKQRAKIFKDMKKAYDFRGQIVHGNIPPSRDELRGIVPKIEEYLRQSIIRFLSLLSKGMLLKEIREKLLDENILKNGKILALRD